MSAVDEFLEELADRRVRLSDERDRLGEVIEQIDSILAVHTPERKRARKGAEKPQDKEALRSEIVKHCREAYPEGLTTAQLYGQISHVWDGEISMRRIGTLCAATTELAGQGPGPYYYVPAEGEDGEGRLHN